MVVIGQNVSHLLDVGSNDLKRGNVAQNIHIQRLDGDAEVVDENNIFLGQALVRVYIAKKRLVVQSIYFEMELVLPIQDECGFVVDLLAGG